MKRYSKRGLALLLSFGVLFGLFPGDGVKAGAVRGYDKYYYDRYEDHSGYYYEERDKRNGKYIIDQLEYLSRDQKIDYKEQIDRARNYQEIDSIIRRAERTNDNQRGQQITITFVYEDGTGNILNRYVNRGNYLNRFPIPTRSGYEFIGWYDRDGKAVSDSTVFYNNTSLYAKWRKATTDKKIDIQSFRATRYRITGYTTESYGNIILNDGRGKRIATATSDMGGYFDLSPIDLGADYETKGNGDYYIYVEKSGYKTSQRYYLATKNPVVEKVEVKSFSLYSHRIEGYTTKAHTKVNLYDNYGYSIKSTVSDESGFFSIAFDYKDEYPFTDYHLVASKEGYGYGPKHFLRVENAVNKYHWGAKLTRVFPEEFNRTNYSVEGKVREAKIRISVYEGHQYLGSDTTDSQGRFKINWNRPWVNKDSQLQYFTGEGKVKDFAVTPTIEEAKAGTRIVKGKSAPNSKVIIYTGGNYIAGEGNVDRDGRFEISLSSDLVGGETITVLGREDGKLDSSTTRVIEKRQETVKHIAYIVGYPDGSFRPNANVTRGEAAQMFATLLQGSKNFGFGKSTPFKDSNDSWFSEAINYVVDKGLISGYGDGTFKPNRNITRAEFAQMISGYLKSGIYGDKEFSDVKGHWAEEAIKKIYKNDLVSGYPDGSFQPDRDISRAEAVTILNGVFGRKTTPSSLGEIGSRFVTFTDVSGNFWAYYDILDAANGHTVRKDAQSGEDYWIR